MGFDSHSNLRRSSPSQGQPWHSHSASFPHNSSSLSFGPQAIISHWEKWDPEEVTLSSQTVSRALLSPTFLVISQDAGHPYLNWKPDPSFVLLTLFSEIVSDFDLSIIPSFSSVLCCSFFSTGSFSQLYKNGLWYECLMLTTRNLFATYKCLIWLIRR